MPSKKTIVAEVEVFVDPFRVTLHEAPADNPDSVKVTRYFPGGSVEKAIA